MEIKELFKKHSYSKWYEEPVTPYMDEEQFIEAIAEYESNRLEKLVSQPSEPSCENCKWHSTDHETCMNRINWDKLNRKVPIYIPDIIAKIISCKQFEQP